MSDEETAELISVLLRLSAQDRESVFEMARALSQAKTPRDEQQSDGRHR